MENLELKIAALRESAAQNYTSQEDRIADLRVALTVVSRERDDWKNRAETAEAALEQARTEADEENETE